MKMLENLSLEVLLQRLKEKSAMASALPPWSGNITSEISQHKPTSSKTENVLVLLFSEV